MNHSKFDFDTVHDRRGTHSFKWDAQPMKDDPNLLPLFVADMDFETAPAVREALQHLVKHGIYGYTMLWDEYLEAVAQWMKKRHGMDVETEWIVPFPGVVPAIKHAIRTFTEPGDGILVFKPVYYPFDSSVKDNGRRLVEFPLREKDGEYSIDFQALEEFLKEHSVKMIIFCSPHNPVGKVWSEKEITSLARLAREYGILVVSDEIHMDFSGPDKPFVSFLTAAPELKDQLIVATAPSKTFNLAGLQTSNILIENEELRTRWKKEMADAGLSTPNLFGLGAAEAAYRHGEEWLDALLAYIDANFDFMKDWFAANMPEVKMRKPEGLYLAWADFRPLGLSARELEDFMLKEAHVWLDEGYIFGSGGEGFERFNCACPRSILEESLNRIGTAWKKRTEKLSSVSPALTDLQPEA